MAEKCQRKSTCLWRLLSTRWKREGHDGEHFTEFSSPLGLRGVLHQVNFPNLTNVFVSVIVFPLNLIARVSFVFYDTKSDRITLIKIVPILDCTWTHHLSDGCLFVQSLLSSVLTERLNVIDKTWFYIIIFIVKWTEKDPAFTVFQRLFWLQKGVYWK